ncbi:DNA polymerase III subunit delta' [Alteromonas sp. 5E99-2]|uniref:DNA polymerase III subunit delta' n=1 Tax=Alteromonas sp. 5E99-2 TaxID=2817683 RepID=UPI001A98C371|nr:DNA polymerase III subunit delta' [Alteromonas sp. 5E99-2]MBO1254967.1 DNA polymerase III subunit delta' [Alteromonas sp. 5E99-2]
MNFDISPWSEERFVELNKRILASKLHHGLLLSGKAGIGKTQFAVALAKSLLCDSLEANSTCGKCQGCLLLQAGSHPDFHPVESEKQIGVDAIRQVTAQLQKTPQIGKNKVCIIYQAESLTEAAANALLKTLEEPTPNTYIILVTDAQHKLLPTILSRCEKQGLSPPTKQQTIDWLAINLPNVNVPGIILDLFAESPYRLNNLLTDEKFPDASQFESMLKQIKHQAISGLSMVKLWENHADILLSMCALKTGEIYQSSLSEQDYAYYQLCVNAQEKINQTGINKALLLHSVVENTALAYKE